MVETGFAAASLGDRFRTFPARNAPKAKRIGAGGHHEAFVALSGR